jgi:hypothetical protein
MFDIIATCQWIVLLMSDLRILCRVVLVINAACGTVEFELYQQVCICRYLLIDY